MDKSFRYQHEKLDAAVRILMIPVTDDNRAYASAYHEVTLSFHHSDFDYASFV